ncbi:MAG: toxin-antitoxin system HicB family antitoxin [Patescibacteria group bacterium]
MANINIDIPNELHKQAKSLAALTEISLKEYITQAIIEKIQRDSK